MLAPHLLAASAGSTGRVIDSGGNPVPDALIQVLIIDGRLGRIPDGGTFITSTGSDGKYQVQLVTPERHRVLAMKDGYEPSWIVIDKVSPSNLPTITLKKSPPPEASKLRVGDKVIARDFEWCNAEVVRVGTKNTPTPQGGVDLSGRFEVKWDETGTNQWLRRKYIRMRPKLPLVNPIRCPSLTKDDVAKDLMKTVKQKLR
jgi:hypothetical protein